MKVRALDFEYGIARTSIGSYGVWWDGNDNWGADMPIAMNMAMFDSETEARAACQSDFERRVLACLESTGETK